MGHIRNMLPEVMGRHRVKQAALAEAAGLRYATLNALYNGRSKGVDFDTLTSILDGLNALTGQVYTVADLLEYTPASAEDAVWMDADLSRLVEEDPYEWGDADPVTLGKAIHVTPSGEIVADQ